MLSSNFPQTMCPGGKFPPRLNLQLDNTSKDKKGRFVVAYLYMLVCCGCFNEIDGVFFSSKLGIHIVMQTSPSPEVPYIYDTKIFGTSDNNATTCSTPAALLSS